MITDAELEMLSFDYIYNIKGVKDKFLTFEEYVLNYSNNLKKEVEGMRGKLQF